MSSRFAWLVLLVGLVGFPIVNPNLAWHITTVAWDKSVWYLFPPPEKPGPIKVKAGSDPITTVIITADDGATSWYTTLFPIIQKYRLPCTHFILPYRVGEHGFMTWEQVSDIRKWGCDIQSHTLTHRDLTLLTKAEVVKEVAESRRLLQEWFGPDAALVIAAPMGNYNPDILTIIKESGYIAHVRGWGGELEEKNDVGEEGLSPYELARFDVKNYHSADDVCTAVKKAEGKPQLLLFVYHFAARRSEPAPKVPFKTFREIGGQVPPLLHVYDDVFDESMACVARERDAGRIRLSSIPEALEYYAAWEKAHAAPPTPEPVVLEAAAYQRLPELSAQPGRPGVSISLAPERSAAYKQLDLPSPRTVKAMGPAAPAKTVLCRHNRHNPETHDAGSRCIAHAKRNIFNQNSINGTIRRTTVR